MIITAMRGTVRPVLTRPHEPGPWADGEVGRWRSSSGRGLAVCFREVLAIAVSEVMAGGKTKLSPMPADEAMLQRIACYELEH